MKRKIFIILILLLVSGLGFIFLKFIAFRQKPCDLPCLYGITLGESTIDEAETQVDAHFENWSHTNDVITANTLKDEHLNSESIPCHSIIIGADKNLLVDDMVVFLNAEMLSCSDFVKLYGEPDHFFHWVEEQVYGMFYDEHQTEAIIDLMGTTGQPVMYIFIRNATDYDERLKALVQTYPLGKMDSILGYQTQFDYEKHCLGQ